MASGGARPGAGRKKAKPGQDNTHKKISITPSTRRKIADAMMERVKDLDITPLEIMLRDAKFQYDEVRRMLALAEQMMDGEDKDEVMKQVRYNSSMAADSAARVAPYMHAKLQAVTIKDESGITVKVLNSLPDPESK